MIIRKTHSTGTASVTVGSELVFGQSTGWSIGVLDGGLFTMGGEAIPIKSVDSDTQLTLDYPWTAASANTRAYSILLINAGVASTIETNRRLALVTSQINGIAPFAQTLFSGVSAAAIRATLGFTTDSTAPAGPSAFDIAQANGFEGTEAEWLTSLKGDITVEAQAALAAAETAALNAANDAVAAVTSQVQGYVSASQGSAEAAQGFAEDALSHKDAAVTAQGLAEDARDGSVAAQGLAVEARDEAQEFSQSAGESAGTATAALANIAAARDAAVAAQGESEDARDGSVAAQGLSEDARDATLASEGRIDALESAAATSAGASEDARAAAALILTDVTTARDVTFDARDDAQAAETLAAAYANAAPGVEVEPGKYGVQHWVEQAAEIAGGSAAAIAFVPTGRLQGTNVQSALVELMNETPTLVDGKVDPAQLPVIAQDADGVDETATRVFVTPAQKAEITTLRADLGLKADLVGGVIPESQIPAVAITDTFEAASQTEMLALTAQRGDVAVRSDINKSFILRATPATTLANWTELRTPTDAVLSVAGKTGAVVIAAADITDRSTTLATAAQGAKADTAVQPGALGSAAALNAGVAANNVVKLDGSARLPAVDGSQITGLPAPAVAAASDLWAGSDNAKTLTSKTIKDASAFVAFSASAIDLAAMFNGKITLAANTTFAAPTGMFEGQSGVLAITQDATGSRTGAWNAFWNFGAAGVPTLSTGAGKTDYVTYAIVAGGASAICSFIKAA